MRNIDHNSHVRFTFSMFVTEIKKESSRKKTHFKKKMKKIYRKNVCVYDAKISIWWNMEKIEKNQLQIKIYTEEK